MELERRKKFIINSVYYAIIAVIIILLGRFVVPSISPFIIAAMISWALNKLVRIICNAFKLNRKIVVITVVGVFYLTIGTTLIIIGIEAFNVISTGISMIPTLYKNYIAPMMLELFEELDAIQLIDIAESLNIEEVGKELISKLGELLTSTSMFIVGKAGNIATAIPGLFVNTIITIISTFFITLDMPDIKEFLKRQMSDKTNGLIKEVKEYVVGTLWVCLTSYLKIMTITFIELSIGLSLIGIENSIIVALVIAIFDVLPVLGTGGIMIPWTIISLVTGEYMVSIGLSIVYIVVTVIRNIIEPKIVGKQLGLHPIVTLGSMFLGIGLIGGLGIIVFPIGLSLLVHLNEKGTIHILK